MDSSISKRKFSQKTNLRPNDEIFIKKKNRQEVMEKYPNKFIQLDDSRNFRPEHAVQSAWNLSAFVPYGLLFKLIGLQAVSFSRLWSQQMDWDSFSSAKHGFKCDDLFMSFKSVFQDVRNAFDYVHMRGDLKKITVDKLSDYVAKDNRLPQLFYHLKESGAKTFLLTNSEWWYTDEIMTYLFTLPGQPYKPWRSFFDYIVVDSRKPLFFGEGTVLRQVDIDTGKLMIGRHMGELKEGAVYSGGSCEVLSEMIGAKGRDVLYFGDHIYGDVLKSKKLRGWKTFLVVPELSRELRVWCQGQTEFEELTSLDMKLGEIYK